MKHVFNLVYPGTWLHVTDTAPELGDDGAPVASDEEQEISWRTQNLVRLLIDQFSGAAVAFNLLEEERERHRTEIDRAEAYRLRWELRDQLAANVNFPRGRPRENWDVITEIYNQLNLQTEISLSELMKARGVVPETYKKYLFVIQARSLVSFLSGIRRSLTTMGTVGTVGERIRPYVEEFDHLFPDVTDVHDAIVHADEDMRQIILRQSPSATASPPVPRRGPPRPPQGKERNQLRLYGSEDSILADYFDGQEYRCTLRDGGGGRVPLTLNTMMNLQTILQRMLESFWWTGPKQYFPTY